MVFIVVGSEKSQSNRNPRSARNEYDLRLSAKDMLWVTEGCSHFHVIEEPERANAPALHFCES